MLDRDLHVLAHRKRRKGHRLLERAPEAQTTDRVSGLAGNVDAIPMDGPAGGSIDPADRVEQGRLARSVWADDAENLLRADCHIDARKRNDAAEGLAQACDLKRGHARLRPQTRALRGPAEPACGPRRVRITH